MRVLMFGWEFPPLISGGLGTACYGMTKHLAESGEDVIFVLPKAEGHVPRAGYQLLSANEVSEKYGNGPDYQLPSNVTILAVSSPLMPYLQEQDSIPILDRLERTYGKDGRSESIISMSGHYSHNLFEEVQRFAEVGWRLGARRDFDVIHAHDWMTFPAAVAAKQRSGRPFVAHVHATEYDRTGDNPNLHILEVERYGLHQADKIVAVSHRTKALLRERYHIPENKIEVVHNAISQEKLVDPASIRRGFQEKLVIFVGRVTLQKGPEYFLRSAAKVLKKRSNYRFVMCGAGDMLPRMIEEAAQLRIQNRFHFTGFLRGETLDRLYSMADLFVMSSVSEPFGLTPFEAMRYKVPVIVSKQTGAAELLPHAVQVDFWDLDQTAEMMINFCENRRLKSDLLQAQEHTLHAMSWRRVAEQLKLIYQKVVHV
jgi:glycogen(starch) synthase